VERDYLYNSELPILMGHNPESLILGGDFNCTLNSTEPTGIPNPNRVLAKLINGIDLKNTWCQNSNTPVYTHHSQSGASRLDRIYTSRALLARKVGTVILTAAFADLHAVVFSIKTEKIPAGTDRNGR
jgi:endonuclease/exonuclease/phosphatase family metal-dependent hydrolase